MTTTTTRSRPAAKTTDTPQASSSGGGCLIYGVLWLSLLLLVILIVNEQTALAWAMRTRTGWLAMLGQIGRAALRPPYLWALEGTLLLAGVVFVGEGILAALGLISATTSQPKTRVYLRVRIPRPSVQTTNDTGLALLRALHVVLPPMDGGPWLSLVLSAAPHVPVQLGIAITGGTPAQHQTWIAALRKAVRGVNAEAVVDSVPDPLVQSAGNGHLLQAREFRIAPSLPQTEDGKHEREHIDSMGPIAAALVPRAGVAYTECHFTVRPRRDSQTLTDAFSTTIRAVAVAENAQNRAQARGELDELGIVLSRYKAKQPGQLAAQRVTPLSSAGSWALLILSLVFVGWESHRLIIPNAIAHALPFVLLSLSLLWVALFIVYRAGSRKRQRHGRILARAPRPGALRLLSFRHWWPQPLTLDAAHLSLWYHLPTATLGTHMQWLQNRIIHPPADAFVPASAEADWLPIAYGPKPDGSEGMVGMPLLNARVGIAVAAPPGTGKTQWIIRVFVFIRTLGRGLFGIDGKGDDVRGFVGKARRMVTLDDEANLDILDPRDPWTVSLNPLLGIDLADELGVQEALGQIESIFGSIYPETWKNSPRMADVFRKIIMLVLYGEATPTLAHAKQALDDPIYRMTLVPACALRNAEIASFWAAVDAETEIIPEQTIPALRSRFDVLLDTRMMRGLFSLPVQSFSFADAIRERRIVLNPIPEQQLGARAAPIGMLTFQLFLRAAFARPGSDQTRENYIVALDEFDFLVRKGSPEDVARALTKLRSFGVVLILLHQFLIQLGEFKDFVLSIPNRLMLRVDYPDSATYAKLYPHSGLTEDDIAQQDTHLYVRTMYGRAPIGPYSARPLEWLPELETIVPVWSGGPWQDTLPPDSTTPAFDAAVRDLVYTTDTAANRAALIVALVDADADLIAALWTRWQVIAQSQRAFLLANPGAVPLPTVDELLARADLAADVQLVQDDAVKLLTLQRDAQRIARQDWLSRLRIGVPPIFADVFYARIRRPIDPATVTAGATHGKPAKGKGGAKQAAAEEREDILPNFVVVDPPTVRPPTVPSTKPMSVPQDDDVF